MKRHYVFAKDLQTTLCGKYERNTPLRVTTHRSQVTCEICRKTLARTVSPLASAAEEVKPDEQ